MLKIVKRGLIVFAIVMAIVFIEYFGLRQKINLSYILQHREYLEALIANNYLLSVISFITLYTAAIVLLLPVTIIFNLIAGYFFSTFFAFIYCLIGFILGSILSFLLFRFLFRDYLIKKYGPTYQKLNKQFETNGIMFLISLQLFPVTPLPIITMLAALSTMSMWTFIWSSIIGITPGMLIYTFAGKKILHINSPKEILSYPVLIAFFLLACVTFLPMLMQYFQKNKQTHENE